MKRLAGSVILLQLLAGAGAYPQQSETPAGRNRSASSPDSSPYDRWLEESAGTTPVFAGALVEDVEGLELREWAAVGGRGRYLRLADYQLLDARIVEIPAEGVLLPQRHFYEEVLFFLGGRGHTLLEPDGGEPIRIDWRNRSLFSVPLNVTHQHFNATRQPVRYLAVTTFPLMLNLTASPKFIRTASYDFSGRYEGSDDFAWVNERLQKGRWRTNFVLDALQFEVDAWRASESEWAGMQWIMGGDTTLTKKVFEVPGRLYQQATWQSANTIRLVLAGQGYSLIGNGVDELNRIDWQAGTLAAMPMNLYGRDLNPCVPAARYLEIGTGDFVSLLGLNAAAPRFEAPDGSALRQEFSRRVRACPEDEPPRR